MLANNYRFADNPGDIYINDSFPQPYNICEYDDVKRKKPQNISLEIKIKNDMMLELDETFCVNITLPENDTEKRFRGRSPNASVTIVDDDSKS